MPKGHHNNHAKANRQHRWNDEKIISSTGYSKIRVGKYHPLADPNGYAYEHLLVWVAAGNSRPTADQILHHKNEVKTDNRIENLMLMTRIEHATEHHSAMLSDDEVVALRIAYSNGEDGTELAKRFGIPSPRAYKIIRGETRLSAGGPIQTGSLRMNANRNRKGRLLYGREFNEYPRV